MLLVDFLVGRDGLLHAQRGPTRNMCFPACYSRAWCADRFICWLSAAGPASLSVLFWDSLCLVVARTSPRLARRARPIFLTLGLDAGAGVCCAWRADHPTSTSSGRQAAAAATDSVGEPMMELTRASRDRDAWSQDPHRGPSSVQAKRFEVDVKWWLAGKDWRRVARTWRAASSSGGRGPRGQGPWRRPRDGGRRGHHGRPRR